MTTILAFLVTLGVLIVVHEWGHYRAARACDVKVLRFSVGFGRVIWRRQRGETEFAVSMLPLGGYVKMLDERESDVAAAELPRAFNRKPLAQRAFIVAAGPLANLVLAVALYSVANWIGKPEASAVLSTPAAQSLAERAGLAAGDRVRRLSRDGESWHDVASMVDLRWELTRAALEGVDVQLRVSSRDGAGERTVDLLLSDLGVRDVDPTLMNRIGIGVPFAEPVLNEVTPGGAADLAGLRKGDRVLTVDGRRMADTASLRSLIRASVGTDGARTQAWEIERDGRRMSLDVRPSVADDRGQRVGRIGTSFAAPAMERVSFGAIEGASRAVAMTWDVSVLSLRMLGRMLIGQASIKNLSGPITIADQAEQSAQAGLVHYLGFLAVLSVSLGVLNLLPIPMLDGGHLMCYLFEGVTGRPISESWLQRLQMVGLVVIALMMSVALFNDLAPKLGLH
jgi:regulator of sigma E protease